MNRSRQPDLALLSMRWGALWACSIGIWIIAPPLVDAHHLHPDGVPSWIEVVAGLLAICAVTGAFLGLVGGLVPTAIEALSGQRFRNRPWAYRLAMGPIIIVGYVAEAFLIHWNTFHSFAGVQSAYGHDVLVATIGIGAGVVPLLWFYRRVVAVNDVRPSVLGRILCVATLTGAVILVLRTPRTVPAPPTTLPDNSAKADTPPLLFLGIDGATWRVIQPAIDTGTAPTFRHLFAEGIHGTIEAQWPPYWSSAAWASILTGLPRHVTGVYEDLAATAGGLPWFQLPQSPSLTLNPMFVIRAFLAQTGAISLAAPPRALLNGKPVWELMHGAGVTSAVVRFRFTYPADGQADTVISDWVGRDEWDSFGVRRDESVDTVSPHAQSAELLAPFRQHDAWNPALFASLLPGPVPPKPRDALSDPIQQLRVASDIDERTFYASESILQRQPALPFLAVYIGGLDTVEHAFWQYRFPADFASDPPAPQDVERLGPVVDRYVHYLDDRLARLLSRYTVVPNVVIVADHGHGPTTIAADSRGWHAKEGVFLAAGPSVAHRDEVLRVSYYDVLPTLIKLKGLPSPKELPGRCLDLFRHASR